MHSIVLLDLILIESQWNLKNGGSRNRAEAVKY